MSKLRKLLRGLAEDWLIVMVALGSVMFTRFWSGLLALWRETVPTWPKVTTLIPGVLFALVIVGIDSARGTKADRDARLFPRLVALILQGVGVNSLIDQIDKLIQGGT